MPRGKNRLPTVSRQFLTRNYPHRNCLSKCLPNCLAPTREDNFSSFKIAPAVRVIARQLSGKNCLAASRCLSGPSGKPLYHVTVVAENAWEFPRDILSCNCILQEKQGNCNPEICNRNPHSLRIYPYPVVWPLPRPWSETMVSIPL